jgi:hypothetical protein
MNSLDTSIALAIILLAAAIHASFQLSISVLTLMSGHALGRKTARHRLLNLVGGFVFGAGVITILLVSAIAYMLDVLLPTEIPYLLWAIGCAAAVGVGISVWLFYYRKELGTVLWIPRGFARHLDDRARATKSAAESFSLGMTSVVSELLFVFAPIFLTALILIRLPYELQLLGVFLYTSVSILPLLFVGVLISNGKKLSHIQKWRETNKNFLQFAAGGALLILGAHVYVEHVIIANALGGL